MIVKRLGALVIGLLLMAGVAVFLVRCPWSTCRYFPLNTYTITTLDEYREFLSDQAAFKARHRIAGVELQCTALRDDVVKALQDGRLLLGMTTPAFVENGMAKPGLFEAWREDRVLHVLNHLLESQQEMDIWAEKVQETVIDHRDIDVSFLPHLFGGLILHFHKKQTPMVLFSDEPCSGVATL